MVPAQKSRETGPHTFLTHRVRGRGQTLSISPVALIIGFLPVRQQRLVEAWAELHQEELLADWQLLEAGRKPAPITPLQ